MPNLPKIDLNACCGNGSCIEVCPESVLAMKDGKVYIANPDNCIECGACADSCGANALEMAYR